MYVLLVFSVMLVSCLGGYVDSIKKCSMADDKCLNALFQDLLNKVSKDGLPEIGIPPVDPVKVQNVSAIVLDEVLMFMPEASVKGIKSCKFEFNHIDMAKRVARQKINCDITVKGAFTLSGKSSLLQGLLGIKDVTGSGVTKVKLDDIRLNFNLPFNLKRTSDSTIHAHLIREKATYEYDVKNVIFAADKMLIGGTDLTKLVVGYLNENWKKMLEKSGKSLTDKAIEYYLEFAEKFFIGVPTNKFLLEDASKYLS
ncbi:uncharacterized protein LOC121733701 [Aricia agestis]|uniref:uncharacterized protein LOC121733701 n=1 Tax=Aricia agestis TaxID=91739 RepID=UPI001C2062BA|nr:uncharacterized protein LOC121733701 [Aricia agestis]